MGRTHPTTRVIAHPDIEDVSIQQVLEALADPARRTVIHTLAHSTTHLSCGSIHLPVGRSTTSHHFTVLRQAGLLRQYYKGTTKMNTLRTQELEQRFPGLLTAILTATNTETQHTAGARAEDRQGDQEAEDS